MKREEPFDVQPGTSFEGGFFAGLFTVNSQRRALIRAPIGEGSLAATALLAARAKIPEAISYCDGRANTELLANAKSKPAAWALDLQIAGHKDWYLPSLDELEILYRAMKPTAYKNTLWSRSGVNLSAIPPTEPYTIDMPPQTPLELFRQGGSEALADDIYWSSTIHQSLEYAWFQGFLNGTQDCNNVNSQFRAVAVRSIVL